LQAAPPGVLFAAAFLLVLAAAIAHPPLVTHFDPLVSDIGETLQPPSVAHWFGTDRIGRDVFARVIYGARYSMLIGLASMIVALVIGLVIGMTAGLGKRR
jgi:peptide/nickel transport system permease protein